MKKALIVCILAAFSMAVAILGCAVGFFEMARQNPAHAEELLAHEHQDDTAPQKQTTMHSATMPQTSKSVTGNPAGGSNLNDGTTRVSKSDHFTDQKDGANTQMLGDVGDEAKRNPALVIRQGTLSTSSGH